MLLYCYSIESFIYSVINAASRECDVAKAKTIGPYATALFKIISCASRNREDLAFSKFDNITLFRGSGLNEQQI